MILSYIYHILYILSSDRCLKARHDSNRLFQLYERLSYAFWSIYHYTRRRFAKKGIVKCHFHISWFDHIHIYLSSKEYRFFKNEWMVATILIIHFSSKLIFIPENESKLSRMTKGKVVVNCNRIWNKSRATREKRHVFNLIYFKIDKHP